MKHTYVTLMANGNLDHFQANTLTSFTNLLPQALIDDQGNDKIYIRLRKLFMHHRLVEKEDPYNSHVQVHVTELEPNAKSGDRWFKKCLATFPFPTDKDIYGDYAFIDFEHTAFHQIHSVPVRQLSLRLTNADRKPLKLQDGPTTIAIFELSDMDYSNQFTVTCQSHTKYEKMLYPANSLTKFKVHLPEEFSLGDWEVAMVNMSYPADLTFKDEDIYWTYATEVKNNVVTRVDTKFDMSHDYANTDEFTKTLVALNNAEPTTQNMIVIEKINRGPAHLDNGLWRFRLDVRRDPAAAAAAVAVADDAAAPADPAAAVADPAAAAVDAVDPPNNVAWNDATDYVTLEFSPAFCSIFGLSHEIITRKLKNGESFVLKGTPPNIRNILPSPLAMVYCDIVEPCPISNVMDSLLQVVPLKFDTNVGYFEPNHLLFHPITSRSFSNIEFEILQPNGNVLPLDYDERALMAISQGMTFTLLFRRKEMTQLQQQHAATQPQTIKLDPKPERKQQVAAKKKKKSVVVRRGGGGGGGGGSGKAVTSSMDYIDFDDYEDDC